MSYETRYGAFVARSTLTMAKAAALYAAGLRVVVIQVEWQRSRLTQRSVEGLRAEQAAARAAGLEVWWWGWCCPTLPRETGRRASGPRALERRLGELVVEVGTPETFIVDAEVGGRWTRRRLGELPEVAGAARAAGMPVVGLTSHGRLGRALAPAREWRTDAFDLGVPQLYDNDSPVEVGFVRRCLATWDDAPRIWTCLGCADDASTPAQMLGDLRTIGDLGVQPRPGVAWWTARQLRRDNGRLAAAVPPAVPPR